MHSFFTEDQWDWLAERYREGYPIRELSAFLGVHRETVRRGLMRQGVRTGPGGLPPLNERKREFYGLQARDILREGPQARDVPQGGPREVLQGGGTP